MRPINQRLEVTLAKDTLSSLKKIIVILAKSMIPLKKILNAIGLISKNLPKTAQY